MPTRQVFITAKNSSVNFPIEKRPTAYFPVMSTEAWYTASKSLFFGVFFSHLKKEQVEA